jgi:hypothetical protein
LAFKDGIYVTVNALHFNEELVGFRFRVVQENTDKDKADYFDISTDALTQEQIDFLDSRKVKITRLMAHGDLLISYYENEVQLTATDVSQNPETISQLFAYLPEVGVIPQSLAEGEIPEAPQAVETEQAKISADQLLEHLVPIRGKKITTRTIGVGEISGLFKTSDHQGVLVNFALENGDEVQFSGEEFMGIVVSVAE